MAFTREKYKQLSRTATLELDSRLREPKIERQELTVTVRKVYTDVDGIVIDRSTLPANLQKPMPFYLFNYFDMMGNYSIGVRNVPVDVEWKFIQYYLWGGNTFGLFTGLNNIKDLMQFGDIILCFTDDVNLPNYYCYVIMQANQSSIGSIMAIADGRATIDEMLYQTANVQQYKESLIFVRENFLGNPSLNQISPEIFRNPYTYQDDTILLTLKYVFSQTFGIYGYLKFETESIILSFKMRYQ